MDSSDTNPLKRLATGLIAPATITTAVLYYFGWLRSQTIAQHFGYEASTLGLGTQDYILRSVQPVATLAIVGAALGWPALACHTRLAKSLRGGKMLWLTKPRFARSLRNLGGAATAGALVWTWTGFDDANYLLPSLFALAALGLGYGSWLRGFDDERARKRGFSLATEVTWTVATLIVAFVFVLTSLYARETGRRQVEANLERIDSAAVVTLTSDDPLNLAGVDTFVRDGKFVSTGLTLMFTSGGQHFLLPLDYDDRTNARLFTVPVDTVRLDFDNSWALPCVGFEDLAAGERFVAGDSFANAGVRYVVSEAPAGADRSTEEHAVVVEEAESGERGLRLVNATIEPVYQARYDAWLFEYRQRANGVYLSISETSAVAGTFLELDAEGKLAGAADLTTEGGADGMVRIRASEEHLTGMVVGGSDLLIACAEGL